MGQKTSDMMDALSFPNVDLDTYLKDEQALFFKKKPVEIWEKLIQYSGKKKAQLTREAEFEPVYFYEIIGGKKKGSRDKNLRLLIAMDLSLTEIQQALKALGIASLYPRIKRDSILIYAINNSLTVAETNQLLAEKGENTLR